ncbi:MAG TPA: DNA polymerase I [Polyangiaceae bacterium]|nr:DNA polymerase I [Polyangiaceae bacterium]
MFFNVAKPGAACVTSAPVKKLVLVDGTALIFRAYFAIPASFATTSGLHTNAIFGFATMFRKLFAGKKPDYGVVVFDSAAKTFREEKYADYKGQRQEMAGDLKEQLPWIDKVVEANRFPRLRIDGYEADDVIGTLARRGAEQGLDVVIVSVDKDFAQLVGDRVRQFDPMRDVTYDAELVRKKWGVPPSQIVDLFALMGDAIDNIPGVAGIGQKGAATLLEKYGSVEAIYASLGELKGKQKTSLEAGREAARISKELATIDCAVPIAEAIDAFAIPDPDDAVLNALYKELEFYSLLRGDSPELNSGAGASGAVEYRSVGEGPLASTTADVKRVLDELCATPPLAIVPMFDLPTSITGELIGVAVSAKPGTGTWIPFKGDAVPALKAVLEDPKIPKVTHDVKALWQLLKRSGITLRGAAFDTMLASYLVEPTKLIPHRLDQIAREYLQRTMKPLKDLTGAGQKERRVSEIPASEIGPFACHLADAVISAWPKLVERLEKLSATAHLHDHEMPLAFVLGQMELDGIKVDPKELAAAQVEFAAARDAESKRVFELAGREFNIGSTKQLGAVLFDELKLPVVKKTKTGYSTDSEVLERLAPKHEIAKHIVEFRKYEKLINTYTEVLTTAINPATTRVHATFQQTVSASGRLISTDPDLQRTPIRTPEGKRIRTAFIADPGNVMISADWSQIELRVLAHVSGDPILMESFAKNVDVHRRTAAELFHCAPEAVTKEQRNVGKTVNFATIYGQGATALGQILGIPRKEAEGYIEAYFVTYAGVRSWLDSTIEEARKNGYVTTLLGRRRYVHELSSRNPTEAAFGERVAANTPIQGSAADLCKVAMLKIARRLESESMRTRMLVQIHDELLFEAPEAELDRAKAIVKEIMEGAWPLKVPLIAEVGVGKTWADAH